jgi:hypothetical protein
MLNNIGTGGITDWDNCKAISVEITETSVWIAIVDMVIVPLMETDFRPTDEQTGRYLVVMAIRTAH